MMLATKMVLQSSRSFWLVKVSPSRWNNSLLLNDGSLLTLLRSASSSHHKVSRTNTREQSSSSASGDAKKSNTKQYALIAGAVAVAGASYLAIRYLNGESSTTIETNEKKVISRVWSSCRSLLISTVDLEETIKNNSIFVSPVVPLKIPQNSKSIPKKVPYLLVGGGTCSFSAFRSIKSYDPTAKVLLISSEPYYPYMRPPLTKEIWSEDNHEVVKKLSFKQWNGAERSLFFEPEEFFLPIEKFDEEPKGGLSVARGWSVTKIDADKNLATLDDGTQIEYGKCLLATGIHPKVVAPFDRLENFQNKVSVFRNIEDFKKLRAAFDSGVKSVAIVGGSLLGSELACSLSKFGSSKLEVSQIFPEKGSLAKILPEYLSKWTTDKIREQGVNIISGLELKSAVLANNDKQVELTLSDGKKIHADHVILAAGSYANTELAKSSHLEIDPVSGGYLVNNELAVRSDLYAAGDCACYYDVLLGRRRVEHHDHAVSSGRLVGENMTGARKSYVHQPMFWSELGPNIGFEAIGLVDPSLPTVAVYAKSEPSSEKETSPEKENNVAEKTTPSKITTKAPQEGENYRKGVIFYLRDDIVVGIILWNVYGKVLLARQVLKEQKKFEDLNEVAKLFEIHEE